MIWCALLVAAFFVFGDHLPTASLPFAAKGQAVTGIRVIDGDTIGFMGGKPNARLVGFNAPETADAKCEIERQLGQRAKDRLRELVNAGGISVQYVACSCPPGTQGTDACNYGRDCARLRSNGRDVANILVSEGLAERYVCGASSCPRRRNWC